MPEITMMPVQLEHLMFIRAHETEKDTQTRLLDEKYAGLMAHSHGFSFWVESRCIAAVGYIALHPKAARAWALLSPSSGPWMLDLTKRVIQMLDMQPYDRVEMFVKCDFQQGHQWAKLLGFKLEAERMRKSCVTGDDEALYARVR